MSPSNLRADAPAFVSWVLSLAQLEQETSNLVTLLRQTDHPLYAESSVLNPLATDFAPSHEKTFTFNPLPGAFVPESRKSFVLNPLATSFTMNAEITQTLSPVAQVFVLKSILNPRAAKFVPRFKFDPQAAVFIPRDRLQVNNTSSVLDPCALVFIPTPATNPQPWGAPVVSEIDEHAGQLLQRAHPEYLLSVSLSSDSQQESSTEPEPAHEDYHERQRQDFKIFMHNDDLQAHHFTWTGKPVNQKNQTSAALSLAIIMFITKADGQSVTPNNDLQKSVCVSQALDLLDPVLFCGSKELLTELSLGELREAATGLTYKFYSSKGWWCNMDYEFWTDDEEIPIVDGLNIDEYDQDDVILNGWYANHNVPLREDFITTDFKANMDAEEKRVIQFQQRLLHKTTRSHMNQCLSRDDIEVPTVLDILAGSTQVVDSQPQLPAEVSSVDEDFEGLKDWADEADSLCSLLDDALYDWKSRCVGVDCQSTDSIPSPLKYASISLPADVPPMQDYASTIVTWSSTPGLTMDPATPTESVILESVGEYLANLKDSLSDDEDEVHDLTVTKATNSVGAQFNTLIKDIQQIADDELFDISLKHEQKLQDTCKTPDFAPLTPPTAADSSSLSDEDISALESMSPVQDAELQRILELVSPCQFECTASDDNARGLGLADRYSVASTDFSKYTPAATPKSTPSAFWTDCKKSAPTITKKSSWSDCKKVNHGRSTSLAGLPDIKPVSMNQPKLRYSSSMFDLRESQKVPSANELFLAPMLEQKSKQLIELIAKEPQRSEDACNDDSDFETEIAEFTAEVRLQVEAIEQTVKVQKRIESKVESLKGSRMYQRRTSNSGAIEVMPLIPDSPSDIIRTDRPHPPTPTRTRQADFEITHDSSDSPESLNFSEAFSTDEFSVSSSPPLRKAARHVTFAAENEYFPAEVVEAVYDLDEPSSISEAGLLGFSLSFMTPSATPSSSMLSFNEHQLEEPIVDTDSEEYDDEDSTPILSPVPILPSFKTVRPKKSLGRKVSNMVTEGLRKVSPRLTQVHVEAEKPKQKSSVLKNIKTSLKKVLNKKMNVLK